MLLCMDLGGTAVKLGLVDAQGHIHQRTEANVRSDGDATPILTAAMAAAKDFLTGTGVTVEGIGVSATGQVDSSTGVVIGTNGAIPHYEGVNIREAMEEAFGLPVRVLNDANAAVLAAAWCWMAACMAAPGELPESWDIFPWSAVDGPAPAETGDAWSSMPPRRPWFAWPARPPAKRRSMAGRSLPVLPGRTRPCFACWRHGRRTWPRG